MEPRRDASGIPEFFVDRFPGVALISFAYPALPAVIPAGMMTAPDGRDDRHVPSIGSYM